MPLRHYLLQRILFLFLGTYIQINLDPITFEKRYQMEYRNDEDDQDLLGHRFMLIASV